MLYSTSGLTGNIMNFRSLNRTSYIFILILIQCHSEYNDLSLFDRSFILIFLSTLISEVHESQFNGVAQKNFLGKGRTILLPGEGKSLKDVDVKCNGCQKHSSKLKIENKMRNRTTINKILLVTNLRRIKNLILRKLTITFLSKPINFRHN